MRTKIEIEGDYRKALAGAYRGENDDWNEGYQIALEWVLGLDKMSHTVEGNRAMRERWNRARSSAVERGSRKAEAVGSNPTESTILDNLKRITAEKHRPANSSSATEEGASG